MSEEMLGMLKCWRCGMLLPDYELQMWDGQLFCAYCLQDIKMEKVDAERARAGHAREMRAEAPPIPPTYARETDERDTGKGGAPGASGTASKAEFHFCESCGKQVDEGRYAFSGKFVCNACFSQESTAGHGGLCIRCGTKTDQLYMLGGEQLCLRCFNEERGGGPGWATQLRTTVSNAVTKVERRIERVVSEKRGRQAVAKVVAKAEAEKGRRSKGASTPTAGKESEAPQPGQGKKGERQLEQVEEIVQGEEEAPTEEKEQGSGESAGTEEPRPGSQESKQCTFESEKDKLDKSKKPQK